MTFWSYSTLVKFWNVFDILSKIDQKTAKNTRTGVKPFYIDFEFSPALNQSYYEPKSPGISRNRHFYPASVVRAVTADKGHILDVNDQHRVQNRHWH